MFGKKGLLILTVVSAILLTGGLNPGQKAIAANLQEEGETCTVNKSAKLRNAKTGRAIATLAKGTKVHVLGGGLQGWYRVRVKRGKRTITGNLNLPDMKCPSNPDTQ